MRAQTPIAIAAVLAATLVVACDPPAAGGDCAGACASAPPSCEGCPAVAEELCVDDACIAVAAGDADIIADVSIDRALTGVVAVTIAVVDGRTASCATLGDLTEAPNVLAGNRIDVSGGPFHPDLSFGLVPAGCVLVAADGLDASGAIVGGGCVALLAVAGQNDAGVVIVAP